MLPIYYIGIVQAFFAALVVRKKSKKSQADTILFIWLIAIGFEMLYSLLNLTVWNNLPDLIVIPFTYGPFLYFYTYSLISNEKVHIISHFKHFIPFLLFFILAIVWSGGQEINTIDYFNQGWKTSLSFVDFIAFIISIFWYWIMVFNMINNYQKQLTQQLSFQNNKFQINWIKSIAWWILGAFILSSIFYLVFILKNIYPFNPIVIYHLGLVILIFSISYYGIHQPPLPSFKGESVNVNKSKAGFSNDELLTFGRKLERYMVDEKPYLNGELTIQELAMGLNESDKKISTFINNNLNKNFFTFINDYRIRESMNRIKDVEYADLTIMAIAFDSGFNSKSSFNSLFKKYNGITPSEYQKQHFKKE